MDFEDDFLEKKFVSLLSIVDFMDNKIESEWPIMCAIFQLSIYHGEEIKK
jgi:hypothetical protein